MSKPWLPEQVISLLDAQQIIEEQFPELKPVTLKHFGSGWDNTAFLVNHNYIFRFPRREIAVPWLETEIALLPTLASKLPLQIPLPIFIGKPSFKYLWPFLGYKILPGKTAEIAKLTMQQRSQNAIVLAEFLKMLHNIPAENLAKYAAKEDDIQRLELSVRVPKTLEMFDRIIENNYFEDVSRFTHYLKSLTLKQPKFRPCLLHGDLYAKHLLVDSTGKIIGVIDWGDMHIGNSALDLEIVHGFLPVESHQTFRQHYGAIQDDIWELGFIRAIYASALLMVYAHDVQDQDLLVETHTAFEILLQNPILPN